jgi:uncharacterized protein (UPF0297 family)
MIQNYHNFLLETKRINEDDDNEDMIKLEYMSCVEEAISSINKMINYLASLDPSVSKKFIENKKSISSDLGSDLKSHGSFWGSIDSLSSDLENEIKNSDLWKGESSGIKKKKSDLEEIEKKLKSGDMEEGEARELIKKIEGQTTSEQARSIYFEKTKEAFKYYRKSVRAFSQGGTTVLKNYNSKSPNWLREATNSIIRMIKK